LLRPSEVEKKLLLIETLSNVLWNAGEKQYACLTLNKNVNCFTIEKGSPYVPDGITEKVLNIYPLKIPLVNFQNNQKLIDLLLNI